MICERSIWGSWFQKLAEIQIIRVTAMQSKTDKLAYLSVRWSVLMVLSLMFVGAGAQPLSQEEKLAAIRQGLLQAALEGPTKVQSTVWLDSKGSLQESSSFKTGMQVRGVKVLSYGRDSQGQPSADLKWQPEIANSTPLKTEKSCASNENAGALQHVIGLSVDLDSDWGIDDTSALRTLKNVLSKQWEIGLTGLAIGRMTPVAGGPVTAYEKALTGSAEDEMPWHANLSLQPAPKPPSVFWPTPSGPMRVPSVSPSVPEDQIQLRLSVRARNQNKPIFEAETQIIWKTDKQNWEAPRLSKESQDLLLVQMKKWGHEISQVMACVPVSPEVILVSDNTARINAGSLAGVRVGDELLLTSGPNYIKKILNSGAVSASVLAKVQAVGAHHAQLQFLAGPQKTVLSSWRAWPADADR